MPNSPKAEGTTWVRDRILDEIRKLAAKNGKPPGKLTFARQTGISEHQWSGTFWPRWGDALTEAGFSKNELQGRFDTTEMVTRIADVCRQYGRLPTVAELKLIQPSPAKGR